MTYPNDEVTRALNEDVVAFQANIAEPRPDLRELFRRAKSIWAPMFLMFGSSGAELRRWTGWLPPPDFLDQIAFGRAFDRMARRDPDGACQLLEEVVDAGRGARAEGLYWLGAAAYKRDGGGLEALGRIWERLREEFPGSTWATRADVMEFASEPNRE